MTENDLKCFEEAPGNYAVRIIPKVEYSQYPFLALAVEVYVQTGEKWLSVKIDGKGEHMISSEHVDRIEVVSLADLLKDNARRRSEMDHSVKLAEVLLDALKYKARQIK